MTVKRNESELENWDPFDYTLIQNAHANLVYIFKKGK